MRTVFRDWFTGPNNAHFELARAGWALGFVAAVAFQAFALWRGQTFSMTDFGTGMGLIYAGGGAGILAKDFANPSNRKAKVHVDNVEEVNVDASGATR